MGDFELQKLLIAMCVTGIGERGRKGEFVSSRWTLSHHKCVCLRSRGSNMLVHFTPGLVNSKARHICKMTCYYCQTPDQCKGQESNWVYCQFCNIIYPTDACCDRHSVSGFWAVRSCYKNWEKVVMKSSRERKCRYRLVRGVREYFSLITSATCIL